MDSSKVVSREEWLAARKELLASEKKVTRAKDAVDAARRALPVTEVTRDYTFTGPGGTASLADLFEGRRQLITYHFMWRNADTGFPGQDQGCPACSVIADGVGHPAHLHACDTTLAFVSRAPIASIERFRQRMGWPVPWYSSAASDFNYDFHVSIDSAVAPVQYNYLDAAELTQAMPYIQDKREAPGVSVFLRDGGRIFHSYSAYGRGLDTLIGAYRYLDLTPLGRQRHVAQFAYHDQDGGDA